MASGSNLPPIIIKRNGRRGHGAVHGSTTWKIALADFMTAMFIIFLCLWLINQITPEQRTGIADYFSPAAVTRSSSGSGQILGGQTITEPGTLKQNTAPVSPIRGGGPSVPQEGEGSTQVPGYPGSTMAVRGDKPGGDATGSKYPVPGAEPKPTAPQPTQSATGPAVTGFEELPGLSGLVKEGNVLVAQADDGLRIEILDSDKRELFVKGSAQPLPQTRALMQTVAKVIEKLPNRPAATCADGKTIAEQPYPIEITGHTDGLPFGKTAAYTNWELSADRANSSRRLLVDAGIASERIAKVTGVADKDPLIKDDPNAAGNRRISITLLRERCPPTTQAASADSTASGARFRGPIGPAPEGRLIPR